MPFRRLFSRSNSSPNHSETSRFAADQTGIESGVPLEDVPRRSTETTRRNGFRQSIAPDRGMRIMEDIRNGNYPCSICTEPVAQEDRSVFHVWHCELCHNVFHFQCIEAWADPDPDYTPYAMRRVASWTCSFCLAIYRGIPRAMCWCGKHAYNDIDSPYDSPNTCNDLCEKVTKCRHDKWTTPCAKPCHPGPCNTPCKDGCVEEVPDIAPVKLNSWDRVRKRLQARTKGSLTTLLLTTLGALVMYVTIAAFTKIHIRWWTQLWRYHHFTEVSGRYEILSLILVGIFVVLPMLVVVIIPWLVTVGIFFKTVLNLGDRSTRAKQKAWTKGIGQIFLALVAVASIIIPFVALAYGPAMAWDSQFRNSCNGFDTRVRMDGEIHYETGIRRDIKPAQDFNFTSLRSPQGNQTFYLGTHFKPQTSSGDPFQYYHRFGGLTNDRRNLVVDVDVGRRAWRLLLLSGLDTENQWAAQAFNRSGPEGFPRLPQFAKVSQTALRNGSFAYSNAAAQYLLLPELDLMIANIGDFLNRCEYEPFIRVHDVLGMDRKDVRLLADQPWSSKSDVRVVMRGAAFGHGRNRLDMCVREGPVRPQASEHAVGVADELMVPLAIISTLRLMIWETGRRKFEC